MENFAASQLRLALIFLVSLTCPFMTDAGEKDVASDSCVRGTPVVSLSPVDQTIMALSITPQHQTIHGPENTATNSQIIVQ
jgi:hypothetical protein